MKRVVCVIVICLSILAGCNNQASEPVQQESSNTSVAQEETSEISSISESSNQISSASDGSSAQSKEAQESIELHGIKGSNYYTVTSNLEDLGLPAPSIKSGKVPGVLNASIPQTLISDHGVEFSYYIEMQSNLEVNGATFELYNMGDLEAGEFLKIASDLIGFCASMPYDTSDTMAAMEWVENNIADATENEPSINIGDAHFFMIGTNADDGTPLFRALYLQKIE